MSRPRVAVVGGGISGLAAALRLERSGCSVELIEKDTLLGGRFGVGMLGDRDVMLGGKNIGRRYTSFRAFTGALGEDRYEPFGINASRVMDGEVVTLDSGHRARSVGNLLRAGAARDLLRLGYLAGRIRLNDANRFLGSRLFASVSRRHDHSPLSSYFGTELTRSLLRPMTVRMNGAEPDEVYPGTFGTNLALLLDTYDQLSSGIQPVLEAFARQITVRYRTTVDDLIVRDGRLVGLRIGNGGHSTEEHRYDGVVLATPAHAAAKIVHSERPTLSRRLAEVRYFPATVALVEYDRQVFAPEVRALVLDDGPCSNAGAYGAEDRHIVRYTFSGRHGRVVHPSQAQLEEWTVDAERYLARHLNLELGERVRTISRHWVAAYCAYLPFHTVFISDVRTLVAGLPGVELAGDYLWGVSLEACCRSGEEAGSRLAAYVAREAAES